MQCVQNINCRLLIILNAPSSLEIGKKTCNYPAPGFLHLRWNYSISQIPTLMPKLSHNLFAGMSSGCNRFFDISWDWTQLASQIISIYLSCLTVIAPSANGDNSLTSIAYACEDVQSYYAGLDHLRGYALKKKLNSIITKHQTLPYKKVWDALEILDAADIEKPESSLAIVEIYSSKVVPKLLAGKPDGWNREHLWPRSYGLINGPSSTDLHNIRPADVNVNSSRGNKYYGECSANSTYCLKPAAKEAASDTETDGERWAPPMQVRGDIARALMYMATCYGFRQSGSGLVLNLSDHPSTAKREMGVLSTLLKWNETDPPSREEKLRNERICRLYQHNRNPFVDHPEYANLIWKKHVVLSHQRLDTSRKERVEKLHNEGRSYNEADSMPHNVH